ncbi:MAG: hypothetical protein KW804_01705 [Candidatus Doudnabacteria bacterium]|nr:hypothetical protein [Candidatus Doudnabacteria bacterium]
MSEREEHFTGEVHKLNPEVVKIPVSDGFKYLIYFSTEQEANQAVTDFWNKRSGTESGTISGLQRGMLKATKHQITSGDRTDPKKLSEAEQREHPGMLYRVEFNGNTDALNESGTEALRGLGLIE